MNSSISTTRRFGLAVGAVLLLGGATVGCGVGTGAPDGWTYMNAHGIIVAHPKSWQEVPAAKLPPGVLAEAVLVTNGRTIADVRVIPGKPLTPAPSATVKVFRKSTFKLGGKTALQMNYTFLEVPPTELRRVTDVTLRTADNRLLDVHITSYGRTNHVYQDTMNRIANSIQVGSLGKGNLVKT